MNHGLDNPDSRRNLHRPGDQRLLAGRVLIAIPVPCRARRLRFPIDVKAGDRVLFGKWSGTEVKVDDVEYPIMKESDIMGVLVEAESRKKAA